jgi:ATP-dependent DNA helicase RecG
MNLSVKEPSPTVAGILVLGTRPRDFIPSAYVQFLRVADGEWGGPVHDEAVLEGSIGDMIRHVDEKLAAHNRTAVDFTSGPVESGSSTYPRQLFTSSFATPSFIEPTRGPIRRSASTGSTIASRSSALADPTGS